MCDIFVTPMDGSLVIMEGSLSLRILLLQWILAFSLCKVVCCRDFCYSNGWQPCHYRRQSLVEIFITLMDGSLVITEGSLLSRFFYSNGWQPCLYVRQSVVVIFFYFNGWQPFHYGSQSVVKIFFTLMDGSLVVTEASLLSISLLLNG